MKKNIIAVIVSALWCSQMVFAIEEKEITFTQEGFTFKRIEGNKVELTEIPQKYKNSKLSNCLVDLTSIIKHKKEYYELVSIADSVFSGIFKGNHMVLQIPSTVTHIGLGNQVNDLYYNYNNFNNWMDADRTILLSRNGDSIVWINTTKSHRFKHIPIPETLKMLPSWFWECFPNLQSVILPENFEEKRILQVFYGCTPYLRGNTLYFLKRQNANEIIWKSPLCDHVTILDYPRTWDSEQQTILKEHFPSIEICLVDGCEHPCIVMNGIPYNSATGAPAIELPANSNTGERAANDTLSVSANQFSIMTREFIAAQNPKHINIINNTRGDIRFDREPIEYISLLVNKQDVTTYFFRINKCFIGTETTPYNNIGGNFYNPTNGELFILNQQDTIEVWMNDKNREEVHTFIEKMVAEQAVSHIKYGLNEDTASPTEQQDINRIQAKGISVSSSRILKVAEVQPKFPGGISELMKFLQKNVKYPSICQQQGIQGRVVVQFVIDENGNIVNPKVSKKVNPYLDREALRVISSMPSWEPGMQRGKAVRVRYSLPVTFRLSK